MVMEGTPIEEAMEGGDRLWNYVHEPSGGV